MSYYSNDGFTELEIECGIPTICAGYDPRDVEESDYEIDDEKLEPESDEVCTPKDFNYFVGQEREIVNSFALLKLKNQLLVKISQKNNIDDYSGLIELDTLILDNTIH